MQQVGGQSEPGRPYAPGYGIPSGSKGLLPWGFAEERMAAAQNYWVATVRPDGRPHLTPAWGVGGRSILLRQRPADARGA